MACFSFGQMAEKGLDDIYRALKACFIEAGLSTPALDARLLLKDVLGAQDQDFILNKRFDCTFEAVAVLDELIARRVAGEPLSRILGHREFWGLPFMVTPAVLDPRPDTETIVSRVLALYRGGPGPRRILDLGTGSGCLITALLHEFRDAEGVAVDISGEALEIARHNTILNGVADRVRLYEGSWFEPLRDRGEAAFDLIVSNPPYIATREIPNLEKAVRYYDPILALTDGHDGLDAYKNIFAQLKPFLSRDGYALFEIGISQHEDVMRLAGNAGFFVSGVHADLAGILRVVEIRAGEK